MGGYGSSRWGFHSKKTTIEECRVLSTRDLVDYVGLAPDIWVSHGGISWYRGERKWASIGIELNTSAADSWARLHYTITLVGGEPQAIDYRVGLVTTRPHYGGLRWWFVCPGNGCGGRRVYKLYLPPWGLYFLCRHCCDLAYESQSEDRRGRLLMKAQKIRQKLGGGAGLIAPFPEKPKGMHWFTYYQLWEKAHVAELEFLRASGVWLDRLEQSVIAEGFGGLGEGE